MYDFLVTQNELLLSVRPEVNNQCIFINSKFFGDVALLVSVLSASTLAP